MIKKLLRKLLCWVIDNKNNIYHPFVWINGNPIIGKKVYIGGYSEIYAKGSMVFIGDHCDIASFVVINCADSHKKTVELCNEVERKSIYIGSYVFIGTQSAILGGTQIGHHSVIGSGVILKNIRISPYSLVYRDQKSGKLIIKKNYYESKHTSASLSTVARVLRKSAKLR
jgi:acetyltransferase-like isoleucine patch superfamily enzyme